MEFGVRFHNATSVPLLWTAFNAAWLGRGFWHVIDVRVCYVKSIDTYWNPVFQSGGVITTASPPKAVSPVSALRSKPFGWAEPAGTSPVWRDACTFLPHTFPCDKGRGAGGGKPTARGFLGIQDEGFPSVPSAAPAGQGLARPLCLRKGQSAEAPLAAAARLKLCAGARRGSRSPRVPRARRRGSR